MDPLFEPQNKLLVPKHARFSIEAPSGVIGEKMNDMYEMTPLKSEHDKGVHRSESWHLESALFSRVEIDSFAVRRTKAQSAANAHLVTIQSYHVGGVQGRLGDLNVDRPPGAVHIFDLESRVECVQRHGNVEAIILPKAAIGYDPDKHPPLLSFPYDQPAGRLLQHLLQKFFSGLQRENSYAREHYLQLIAFLKLILGSEQKNGDVRRRARDAIKMSMCAFIDANLEDPNLSNAHLLANFGVSRATLFRMFKDYGGVRQYMSNRRLMRAVLDISEGERRRGEITAIAEKWGFSSGASFNRAVRRQFGVTPGSLVNTAVQELANPSSDASTQSAFVRGLNRTADEFIRDVMRFIGQIAQPVQMMHA